MASSGKRKTTMAKLNRGAQSCASAGWRKKPARRTARKPQRARREFGDLVPGDPGDPLPGDFNPGASEDEELTGEPEDQPPADA